MGVRTFEQVSAHSESTSVKQFGALPYVLLGLRQWKCLLDLSISGVCWLQHHQSFPLIEIMRLRLLNPGNVWSLKDRKCSSWGGAADHVLHMLHADLADKLVSCLDLGVIAGLYSMVCLTDGGCCWSVHAMIGVSVTEGDCEKLECHIQRICFCT